MTQFSNKFKKLCFWTTFQTINAHLEIYRQCQNLDFINSSNKNKSDLNSKGLHLLECGAVS